MFFYGTDVIRKSVKKVIRSRKNVLTDLFYSTLKFLNILACSANFLVMYICTVKICGEYLAVKSHFFEFAGSTLNLLPTKVSPKISPWIRLCEEWCLPSYAKLDKGRH